MRGLAALFVVPVLALLFMAGTAALTRSGLHRWAGTTAVPDPRPIVFHEPFHGRPFEEVWPLDPTRWELQAAPGVTVRTEAEGLVLEIPRATPGWLRPHLPLVPAYGVGSRAGLQAGAAETLQWEARVDAAARFFVVAELRFAPPQGAVLLQATPVDLQITSVTGAEERSDSVPHIAANDDRFHLWRLVLADGRLVLALDGSPRWSRDLPGLLAAVRFGEVRTDELHGGRLWLRDVIYLRRRND